MKNDREIEVKPLPKRKRHLVFILSFMLFVVAVPISVFYAIGYRFDFTDQLNNIKSVGGMYVTNDTDNTEMFVDDKPILDMRVFRKAAYIQNLTAGIHRVHVQGDQVQTWVKDLPVYAHFVTEVSAFNVPKVPQIRIITKWTDPLSGLGVEFSTTSSSKFDFASVTNKIIFSATTSTSSLLANTEYTYIESLFASSTEFKLLIQNQGVKERRFGFDVPTTSAKFISATTSKSWRDTTLFEKGNDVYISWDGDANDTPHYYCIRYSGEKKTSLEYGTHVYEALKEQSASSTDLDAMIGERLCRTSIRIDRLNQKVFDFDFYPDSTDIILMHLEKGLYAVEVDDRAWQNTQLLYPGLNIQVMQDGGRIYVQDGGQYLEVFIEIAS